MKVNLGQYGLKHEKTCIKRSHLWMLFNGLKPNLGFSTLSLECRKVSVMVLGACGMEKIVASSACA